MINLKTFLIVAFASLTITSGSRSQQQYRFDLVYPPADSAKYTYTFHYIDCWNNVCIAAGNKADKSLQTIDRNVLMLFRSTDGGITWVEQDPGLPHEAGDVGGQLWVAQQIDSLNAVAAGDSGHMVRTTDGGNTWQKQNVHYLGRVFDVNFSDPMTGIEVMDGNDSTETLSIETTSDGGNTWNFAMFRPWPYFANACHSDGGENFRAIGYYDGPVYTTSNDWNSIDSTQLIIPTTDDSDGINRCNFRGSDTIVAYGASISTAGVPSLYLTISTDGGANWTKINFANNTADFTGGNTHCMSALDRNDVFLGSSISGNQILGSTDHGMSWQVETFQYYSDTIPSDIYAIATTANNNVMASFGESAFTANNPDILARGVPISSGVTNAPSIDSNLQLYPNPATEKVCVTFSAGSFTILDPLGRSYVVPRNGTTLDISSLPSGVYFVSDGLLRAKFVKE